MKLPAGSNRISGTYVHGKLSTDHLIPSSPDFIFEVFRFFLFSCNWFVQMGREAAVVTLDVDAPNGITGDVQQKLHQVAKRLAMHVVSCSLHSILLNIIS